MPCGAQRPKVVKLVTVPVAVIRLMELPSANQSAPSGPAVIPLGEMMTGSVNEVTFPLVVTRLIARDPGLANHSARPGPPVIPLEAVTPETLNIVTLPPVVIRPIPLGFATQAARNPPRRGGRRQARTRRDQLPSFHAPTDGTDPSSPVRRRDPRNGLHAVGRAEFASLCTLITEGCRGCRSAPISSAARRGLTLDMGSQASYM